MDFVKVQFLLINLTGIIILGLLLLFSRRSKVNVEDKSMPFFKKIVASNIIILACDSFSYLLHYHSHPAFIALNHLFFIIYFTCHLVFGYYWFKYCFVLLFPEKSLSKRMEVLILIPCFVSFLIILSSIKTKFVYSISSDNLYSRGPLLNLIIVIAYSYWIVTAVIVIKEALLKERIRESMFYWILLVFPLPIIIVNFFQMKYYGISYVWTSSALSLLLLYLYMMNSQLSIDMLTSVYNRRATNTQLALELKQLKKARFDLALIIADIDHFKVINDTHGHLAGDQALRTTAKILTDSCSKKNFVARFGGDEFIILLKVNSVQVVKQTIENIYKNLEQYNANKVAPYTLSLSVGYSIAQKKTDFSYEALLTKADEMMYENKSHKK